MPMLSSMPRNSSAGISWRTAASTSSTSLAVSSMRVPLRARRCSRNCPASTDGKKSCPSCGTSSIEPTQNARKITAKGDAMVQHRPQQDAVALAEAVEAALEAGLHRRQRPQPGRRRGRLVVAGVVLHVAVEPHHQRRHQRPRQHVAGQHREHHRLGQRHEQVVRHARSGRTSARTRCRCRAWRRRPASRSPARRPGSRRPALCPRPCGGGCFQWPPSRHPPECRPPAPARPGSSG